MTTDGPLPQRDELRAWLRTLERDYAAAYEAALRGERNRLPTIAHTVMEALPGVIATLEDYASLAARRDDLAERVARVEVLADVVRRLQKPDPDTGDRDVSFFALMEALYPDRAALTSDRAATEGGGERG